MVPEPGVLNALQLRLGNCHANPTQQPCAPVLIEFCPCGTVNVEGSGTRRQSLSPPYIIFNLTLASLHEGIHDFMNITGRGSRACCRGPCRSFVFVGLSLRLLLMVFRGTVLFVYFAWACLRSSVELFAIQMHCGHHCMLEHVPSIAIYRPPMLCFCHLSSAGELHAILYIGT